MISNYRLTPEDQHSMVQGGVDFVVLETETTKGALQSATLRFHMEDGRIEYKKLVRPGATRTTN
jgi:hypothetical protein